MNGEAWLWYFRKQCDTFQLYISTKSSTPKWFRIWVWFDATLVCNWGVQVRTETSRMTRIKLWSNEHLFSYMSIWTLKTAEAVPTDSTFKKLQIDAIIIIIYRFASICFHFVVLRIWVYIIIDGISIYFSVRDM